MKTGYIKMFEEFLNESKRTWYVLYIDGEGFGEYCSYGTFQAKDADEAKAMMMLTNSMHAGSFDPLYVWDIIHNEAELPMSAGYDDIVVQDEPIDLSEYLSECDRCQGTGEQAEDDDDPGETCDDCEGSGLAETPPEVDNSDVDDELWEAWLFLNLLPMDMQRDFVEKWGAANDSGDNDAYQNSEFLKFFRSFGLKPSEITAHLTPEEFLRKYSSKLTAKRYDL